MAWGEVQTTNLHRREKIALVLGASETHASTGFKNLGRSFRKTNQLEIHEKIFHGRKVLDSYCCFAMKEMYFKQVVFRVPEPPDSHLLSPPTPVRESIAKFSSREKNTIKKTKNFRALGFGQLPFPIPSHPHQRTEFRCKKKQIVATQNKYLF